MTGFETVTIVCPAFAEMPEGSDIMEYLPRGEAIDDALTSGVELVSLGCMCSAKLSFQRLGRGSATLPFDWVRTRCSGLLHFLRHDFDGFFDWEFTAKVADVDMTVYRSYYHSFWHDDPREESTRVRYRRRIQRLNEISAATQPVLFVRAAASTSEIGQTHELVEELVSRFGPRASLLLILDIQDVASGPAVVEGMPDLLVYFIKSDLQDGEFSPYCECIQSALDWVVGRPTQAMVFSSLDQLQQVANQTDWGFQGVGGHQAFEAAPPSRPWSKISVRGS